MIIQCTKALADVAGQTLLELNDSEREEQHPLGFWHAHVMKVNRRNTILLVNNETLYTVVLYGVKKRDFEQMDKRMEEAIRYALRFDGYDDELINEYFKASPGILFTRGTSRSIQGKFKVIKSSLMYSDELDPSTLMQKFIGHQINSNYNRLKNGPGGVPQEEMHKELERHFGYAGKEEDGIRTFTHFELKLRLDLDYITIYRSVSVPSYFSFRQLSNVILIAFDWMNYHLHEFIVEREGEKMLILQMDDDPDRLIFGEEDKMELRLEQLVSLEEIFSRSYRSINYIYDFGDYWEHEIILENVTRRKERFPFYLGGEGERPPEDVGGRGAFEAYLEIIADEHHPEYESTVEWAYHQRERERTDSEITEDLRRSIYRYLRY